MGRGLRDNDDDEQTLHLSIELIFGLLFWHRMLAFLDFVVFS